MITDLPDSHEFESQGKEWLLQSFEILFENAAELVYLENWSDVDWHFHKGKLATVLVLAHQSIESKLKSEIVEVNPLFLIDINSSNWPTLPQSADKSFDEFYTVNSESLLRIFCALCRENHTHQPIVDLVEEVRIARNKIVHSVHRESLRPNYLIEVLCKTSLLLYGSQLWDLIKSDFNNHPISSEFDIEERTNALSDKLTLLRGYLSNRRFDQYTGTSGREYHCPRCHQYIWDNSLKTARLTPNNPESDQVTCILCNESFQVERSDCKAKGCQGNVFGCEFENEIEYDGFELCLTCLNDGIEEIRVVSDT